MPITTNPWMYGYLSPLQRADHDQRFGGGRAGWEVDSEEDVWAHQPVHSYLSPQQHYDQRDRLWMVMFVADAKDAEQSMQMAAGSLHVQPMSSADGHLWLSLHHPVEDAYLPTCPRATLSDLVAVAVQQGRFAIEPLGPLSDFVTLNHQCDLGAVRGALGEVTWNGYLVGDSGDSTVMGELIALAYKPVDLYGAPTVIFYQAHGSDRISRASLLLPDAGEYAESDGWLVDNVIINNDAVFNYLVDPIAHVFLRRRCDVIVSKFIQFNKTVGDDKLERWPVFAE